MFCQSFLHRRVFLLRNVIKLYQTVCNVALRATYTYMCNRCRLILLFRNPQSVLVMCLRDSVLEMALCVFMTSKFQEFAINIKCASFVSTEINMRP